MNKTDSAVRITHLPTGIVVQCQNERSQVVEQADGDADPQVAARRACRGGARGRAGEGAGRCQNIGFGGDAVRSYVLHPYQQVKDERTELKVGNAQGVLDGDLDEFVHAYLLAKAAGRCCSRALRYTPGSPPDRRGCGRAPLRAGAGSRADNPRSSRRTASDERQRRRSRRERGLDDRLRGRDEGLRAGRRRALRSHVRDREGRVRLHRRRLGLGQVDARPPAAEGARADAGQDRRRRPRPDAAQARQGPDAAPQRRLRLPGLQAAVRTAPRPRTSPTRSRCRARDATRSGARFPRCSRSSGSPTR